MIHRFSRLLFVVGILAALGSMFVLPQASKGKCQYIEGVIIMQGAARGTPTRPVTFCVKDFTTPEELQQLADIFKTKGPAAMENALSKTEKGTLMIGGQLGQPVGFIAKRTQPDGSLGIIMLLDRRIAFGELWNGTRSLDYPFGVVEIKLGTDGKGEGIMLPAAKIIVKPEGVTFESLNDLPWKLVNLKAKDFSF